MKPDSKTTLELFQCPCCQGQGDKPTHHDFTGPKGYTVRRTSYRDCRVCNGTGEVTHDQFEAYHDRQD